MRMMMFVPGEEVSNYGERISPYMLLATDSSS